MVFCAIALRAQDKHIDPSDRKHKHTLSIAKHTSTTFTYAQAKSAFDFGTQILQKCNNKVNANQDVACQVTVQPGSSMGSFGTAGDGLDVINTAAELSQVMGNNVAFVKIVSDIPGNGGTICSTTGSLLACASPGTIVIVSHLNTQQWGEVIIHEFGHCQGLGHRDSPGLPIMHTSTLGNSEVNDTEAAAFHNGGADDGPNRPVDILFLIDDTGSMGEEIDGVRNFLTAALAGFSTSSCEKVFQLVTYKDNVSVRPPTTDLTEIRNQVAGLFASGGGDCPEASMEAFYEIYDKIKSTGRIFHATDASPHFGTGIIRSLIVTALKLRGVKIDNIVSGDCSAISSSIATSATSAIPASDNHDPQGVTSGSPVSSATEADDLTSAIDVFSFMSAETGGVFAFIPEVNSGNPLDRQLYENIGFNILQSLFAPTITHIEPTKGPKGATLALTINGTETHFNSSSAVSFADANITTSNVTVLSSNKLSVLVNIGSATPLGLKDVTVTTTIPGGFNKTAKGKGILNVVVPPTTPTVLSISPSQGSQGQLMTVTITGINTHWNNTSVIDLGPGITIPTGISVSSPTRIDAHIMISAGADPGFRNVTVTTGTEVANENVIGPFLVVATECNLSAINAGVNKTVYYGYAPSACATLSVNGIDNGALADYNISWSNGQTSRSITVCPSATTTYSVTVTKGSCSVTSSVKVCVIDVRCHASLGKVVVCHKPNAAGVGNALCIAPDAVASHLAHGDKLGACGAVSNCNTEAAKELIVTNSQQSNGAIAKASEGKVLYEQYGAFNVYPNPNTGAFVVMHYAEKAGSLTLDLYDQVGRKVYSKRAEIRSGMNTIKIDAGRLQRGIYLLKTDGVKVVSKLLVF